jgi:hypothetical protein
LWVRSGSHSRWSLAIPAGPYYWGVQAIDGAFQGSPFASSTGDGRNQAGALLANGVYLVRMTAEGNIRTRNLVLAR